MTIKRGRFTHVQDTFADLEENIGKAKGLVWVVDLGDGDVRCGWNEMSRIDISGMAMLLVLALAEETDWGALR